MSRGTGFSTHEPTLVALYIDRVGSIGTRVANPVTLVGFIGKLVGDEGKVVSTFGRR